MNELKNNAIMFKRTITCVCALAMLVSLSSQAQTRYSGYYKDLLMDGGIKLNSYPDLPAAHFLGLTMDNLTSPDDEFTLSDTLAQNAVFSACAEDENGYILYPDGAPRFRALYFNGGKATAHGKSLGKTGLDNVRAFVANGGSYVGTCAGAFICSKGTVRNGKYEDNEHYLGIWPGYTTGTRLEKSATGMYVEKKSPLLKYYDFGGDMMIDSVRHNGGCYAHVEDNCPEGTEVLLRYQGDTLSQLAESIHRTVSGWAYKASDRSGRVVVIGSHPERMTNGERLELFSAMLRYAMDGNGKVSVKRVLNANDTVFMTKTCRNAQKDGNDEWKKNARIGDRQFHHFVVNVPKGCKELTINLGSLKGWGDFDMYLFANYGDFAWNDNSQYKNVANGIAKVIRINNPKAGKLFISVFCATTVESVPGRNGFVYTGRTDVLNGVPYTISVNY